MKNYTKVNLTSSDLSLEKQEELRRILPEVFSEDRIDWEKLRTVLGDSVDERVEKFNFSWAGKGNAIKSVLTPSKGTLRADKDDSIKFDESENIFIEGDNLETLKLLQKAYFEKVKMIYIDPPYNTGGDFVYRDSFTAPLKGYLQQTGQVDGEGNKLQTNKETNGRFHSDWLSMMYPRLKLAWNLLKDDGVIFVSIDDHEAAHLRVVLDEIFGAECYLNTFCWVNNLKGRQISGAGAAKTYELIFAYAKNIEEMTSFELSIDYLKSLMPSSYKGFNYEVENDEGGEFVVKNELHNTNSIFNEETRRNLVFNIHYNPESKDVKFSGADEDINFSGYVKITPRKNNDGIHKFHAWRWSKEKIIQDIADLKFVEADGGMKVFTKIREHGQTNFKDIISDISTTNGSSEIKSVFGGKKYFDYPKPTDLIKLFVALTGKNDIILDFFAGSGTTAHAVLKQNQDDGGKRKFILVQLPEAVDENSEAYRDGYKTIADISKERIRRVINGYGEKPQPIVAGFKVFKLGESNYPENQFEFDPEKSEEENEEAFDAYLSKAKQVSLFDEVNASDVIYENIVKEGFSLNAKIVESKIAENTVSIVSDGEMQFLICLDKKISEETIRVLTGADYKGKTFICFDGALDDSAKANLGLNIELKTI